MKVAIYGTGCPNCVRLAKHVNVAAEELGLDIELDKVEDMDDIVAAGIMRTPGLAIDGEIVSEGKVPSVEKLKEMLKN